MTEFAKAWSKYLPDNHRDALFSALCLLSDLFFEDDLDAEDNIFRELLPQKISESIHWTLPEEFLRNPSDRRL